MVLKMQYGVADRPLNFNKVRSRGCRLIRRLRVGVPVLVFGAKTYRYTIVREKTAIRMLCSSHRRKCCCTTLLLLLFGGWNGVVVVVFAVVDAIVFADDANVGSTPDSLSIVWWCGCGGHTEVGRYLGSARNGAWGTSGDLKLVCNEAVLSRVKYLLSTSSLFGVGDGVIRTVSAMVWVHI